MRFDWDANRASANVLKHGITFEEAKTVFDDPLLVDFIDPDHSVDEQRFIVIGRSGVGRPLIVSYTERGPVTRLISARELSPLERRAYEEG